MAKERSIVDALVDLGEKVTGKPIKVVEKDLMIYGEDIVQVIDEITKNYPTDGGGETTTTYTVTFDALGGVPSPEAQTVEENGYATEPTTPVITTPEGYTTPVLDGWYDLGDGTAWDFTADQVTSDITLSAWYQSTRTISCLDEENGSEAETISAYYTFKDDGDIDYLFSTPSEPTDPTGDNREFIGWAYDNDGVETTLTYEYTYPDTGASLVAKIPTDVTEIYALWGEAPPQGEPFVLSLPNTLSVAIRTSDSYDGATGTIEAMPYLDGTYETAINALEAGVDDGSITTVEITQGASVWTFDECEIIPDDGIQLLSENGHIVTIYTNNIEESYIWIEDEGIFNAEPSPATGASYVVVLPYNVTDGRYDDIISGIPNNSDIFLTQEGLFDGYICNYSVYQEPQASAQMSFTYGDSAQGDTDLGEMAIDLLWNDTGSGSWEFDSGSIMEGFDGFDVSGL